MNRKASKDSEPAQPADLHRKAEERLRATEGNHGPPSAEVDVRALVHELQVQQIELEMQNEELRRARVAAEEASEKYGDLFDFAPVAYFLWGHDARILEVNLAGATLLGLDRNAVIHKRFEQFVALEHRPAFANFCERVLTTDSKQTCEIKLLKGGQGVDVLVEGIAAQDRSGQGKLCRAAVIDVTSQKRTDELAATNEALKAEIAARQRADVALRSAAQFPDENPYPVVRIDREGTILYANRSSIALCGEWPCQVGRPAPESFARLVRETLDSGQARQVDVDTSGRVFSFLLAPIADGGYVNLYGSDITDRKRAEEQIARLNRELQQKLQELETLFHTVPIAIGFAEDPQCLQIRGNPAMQRLLGIPPDGELSKSAPPDRQPTSYRVFQNGRELSPDELPMQVAARQGQSGVGQLFQVVREDGRTIQLHSTAVPLLDESGKPRGAVGAFLDVTELKQAEEALRESRERLDLALISSRMATFDWDIVQNKRTWSEGVHRLLGTKPEDFTGAAEEFFQIIHPEDRSTVQAALARAVDSTGQYETEYRAVWPDGSIRHMSARGQVHRDNAGRAVLMTGVCWDITEKKQTEEVLKQSEERYRSLFNTLIEGFCIIDVIFDAHGRPIDYRFLEVNPAFEKQTGLHDARGKLMRDLAPEHEAYWYEVYGKIALTGEPARFVNEAKALDRWFDVSAFRFGGTESRKVAILFNDITERKRMEEAVRRSEALLKTITESTEDAIYAKDCDGRLLLVNPATLRSVGKPADQIVGHTDAEFYDDPAISAAIRENDLRLIAGGVPQVFEETVDTPNGRRIMWSSKVPWRDTEGRIIGIIGVSRDITDRKRVEGALRKSEQEFRALAEAVPQIVWATRPDGWNIYFNQQWMDYTGLTLDESYGHGWNTPFHPDDKQRAWDAWQRATQHNETYLLECRLRRADGVYRWWLIHGAPLRGANGEIQKWLGTCTDIEDLKQAEEALRDREQQFRTLAESIPQLAWMAQPDGHIFWYNQRWYEYTGTTPEQMEGWGWQAVHNPDELPRVLKRWKAAIAEGKPWEDTFPLRRHDGTFRPHLSRAVPTYDQEGRVVRWFGTNTDITERFETEEALQCAKEAAEAANVAKSQFLASMSHELRTPMNAILGMTDLALGEQLPATVRDYLQTAKESADLLLELLNEILDFSRIEAGRFELESTPFRLRKTIGQAVKTLAMRAYEKGLELVFQVADELPDAVVGDSLRLRQVLMNLVSNAIKFTPKGEVVVRVGPSGLGLGSSDLGHSSQDQSPKTQAPSPKTQALTSNAQHALCTLQFSVSDTGIGIASEKLETIFAPFTQADSSTTRRFGGTGLGLAIAQRLVNLMGGHIRVESQPGQGSTFHFTLTLPIAEQADDEGEVTAGDQELFRGLPALVIAASATSRKIFQQTLASWSMQVDEAPDAPSGLAKIYEGAAAGRAYRIVLADAVMPGIDGFTLVEWLQQDPRLAGSVILMLSATDRHNYPDQCRNLTTPCLEKPVPPSALFNAIAKAVGAEGLACLVDTSRTAGLLPVPSQILRVLVAEDTPANRKLVLHVLGNRGHSVTLAQNGQQALELLQERDFDVVLMDVQMPEMDGFQATGTIRKLEDPKKARLPIIAMTAHALRGDRERCLAAGMDGYLSKPIKSQELIGLVERLALKGLGIRDWGLEKSELPTTPDSESRIPTPQSLIPVFDLDEAVSKCCGKYELFEEVASCLFCEADSLLQQMRAAFSTGAATELADAAHRLKGTVAYLGAAPALAATRCAEDIGRSGDLSTASAALETLAMELDRLKEAIDGHRQQKK